MLALARRETHSRPSFVVVGQSQCCFLKSAPCSKLSRGQHVLVHVIQGDPIAWTQERASAELKVRQAKREQKIAEAEAKEQRKYDRAEKKIQKAADEVQKKAEQGTGHIKYK